MKSISLIYPTRNRPDQAHETFWKWHINSDVKNWEFILSKDIDDESDYSRFGGIFDERELPYGWVQHTKGLTLPNRSAIEAINNAAKIATGDILIVVSDDTDCPKHWDTLLLKELEGKSDFCAKVDDGLQPTLVTMPIMDRFFYERYGYIYENSYSHMFADQELTAVAIMTGKYIKLPLTFNHLHYSAGLSPKDALNIRNDSTWHQGETLFNERLKTNFGINNPVVPYSSIQWR